MSAHQFFNRIWYQNSRWGWLFLPFHCALLPLITFRRWGCRTGLFKSHGVDCPVVVVGNISVGGTGKTPFLLWLYERLQQNGIQAGIISRGYKSDSNAALTVHADSLPEQVGDEPYMMYQRTQCPMVIASDRVAAAKQLLRDYPHVQVILSDDGMQHYRLKRDIEIAMVDGTVGLGNGRLIPAGPLREPPSRLDKVDYIVANTKPFNDAPVMTLNAQTLQGIGEDNTDTVCELSDFSEKTVHAVAGIGNPARFFDTLRQHDLNVIEHPFPDHYAFTPKDFEFNDGKPIILTEKDAVKCRNVRLNQLWYLPVVAQLPDVFESALLNHINTLIRP